MLPIAIAAARTKNERRSGDAGSEKGESTMCFMPVGFPWEAAL
jgi:hypothetical protein